jgi:hypothetical protein
MTIVVIIQYTTRGKAWDLGTYVVVTVSGRQEGRHAGQEDHRRGHRPAGFGKPGEQKSSDIKLPMIYGQRTLLSSGSPSAPISATHSGTQDGKQWIANSMRTCSQKSTGEHFGGY